MKIINDLENNFNLEKSAVTIGTFDGLHTGHEEIIQMLKTKAGEQKLSSVVVTFFPHPRTVVNHGYDLKLLTPLEEKKKLFEDLGIDYLYIIAFTKEFSRKTYKDFFDDVLLASVNTKYLVIGYDHKFGKGRDGNINNLKEYTKQNNIGMTIVGPKEIDNTTVSSTKIRNALLSGDVETANKMLGRFYQLSGVVVKGAKRGRTLGFPTANLGVRDDNKLIPKNGVYFVRVTLNNLQLYGVANIGLRPTFNNAREPITEVHILDFDNKIYGEKILIEFIERIRDEKKFSSKEELEDNIKIDVENVRKLIKKRI